MASRRAAERINERFGESIVFEFIDLSKAEADNHILETAQEIENKNYSYPLLVIDGNPRISGQFDIRQLLDAIEVEMEIVNNR